MSQEIERAIDAVLKERDELTEGWMECKTCGKKFELEGDAANPHCPDCDSKYLRPTEPPPTGRATWTKKMRTMNLPYPGRGERGEGKGEAVTRQGMGVGGPRQGTGGTSSCVCSQCGYKEPHFRGTPCAKSTCPKCGARMVGESLSDAISNIVDRRESKEETEEGGL